MKINNNENIVIENDKQEFRPIEPEDIQYYKKIQELKKTNKRLYETEIAGEKVIFRPLKRNEYKEAWDIEFPEGTSEYDMMFERQTHIAKSVVLYPEDAVENIACCAEIVTDLCMVKSGFIEKEDPTCRGV